MSGSTSASFGSAAVVVLIWLSLTGPSVTAQPKVAQPQHPAGDFVQVNGKRLWYESEGSGEPLLVIAGGPGLSHSYFHPHLSALAASHRVIYFDAYGCGKSDRAKSPRGYSFDDAIADVEGLRTALQLGMLNVFGHSYGGFVAQRYALAYPGSVKRLVLANTTASGEEQQLAQTRFNDELRYQLPELWAKVQAMRKRGVRSSDADFQAVYGVPPLYHYFYNPDNARQLPAADPDLYNPELWYAMAGPDADFKVEGELARFDVRGRLRELKMPVLVMAGRFDRNIFPMLSVRYREYLPGAEFVMFERSGHFPFVEETDKTVALLESFLSK